MTFHRLRSQAGPAFESQRPGYGRPGRPFDPLVSPPSRVTPPSSMRESWRSSSSQGPRLRKVGSGRRAATAVAASRVRSSRRWRTPRKIARPRELRQDLAAGAALGGIRPRAGVLTPVEDLGEDAGHVGPVIRVVRLDVKGPGRPQHAVHLGQERRCQDATVRLAAVVVGLGVVEVDLVHARRSHVALDERLGVLDREAGVVQPALVGPSRRVADHHRQDVHGEMVVVRPGQRALEREAAVAAAEVHDDRRLAAEDRRPVERTRPRAAA